MNISESVEHLPTNGSRGRVYGDPYRTADGGMVIPVAKVRAGLVDAARRVRRAWRRGALGAG